MSVYGTDSDSRNDILKQRITILKNKIAPPRTSDDSAPEEASFSGKESDIGKPRREDSGSKGHEEEKEMSGNKGITSPRI